MDLLSDLLDPVFIFHRIAEQILRPLHRHIDCRINLRVRRFRPHKKRIRRGCRCTEGHASLRIIHIKGVQYLRRDGICTRPENLLFLIFQIFLRKSQRIAHLFSRIDQVAAVHRDLIRSLRQPPFHHIGDIQLLPHGLDLGLLQPAVHLRVHALGVLSLRDAYILQSLKCFHIIFVQPQGGRYRDIKQMLFIVQGVRRIAQVVAGSLQSCHHGHAQGCDQQNRKKAFALFSRCPKYILC